MKKVSCFFLLCVLFLNLTSIGYCANFVYSARASNDYIISFYDEASVKSVDYGIIDGWTKGVYTDVGRKWMVQRLQNQLNTVDENEKTVLLAQIEDVKRTACMMVHWQFDFKRRLRKVVSSTDYDNEGRSIRYGDATGWVDIIPESSGEYIMYDLLLYLRTNNKPIIE